MRFKPTMTADEEATWSRGRSVEMNRSDRARVMIRACMANGSLYLHGMQTEIARACGLSQPSIWILIQYEKAAAT